VIAHPERVEIILAAAAIVWVVWLYRVVARWDREHDPEDQ
jgi:hypothetical protein